MEKKRFFQKAGFAFVRQPEDVKSLEKKVFNVLFEGREGVETGFQKNMNSRLDWATVLKKRGNTVFPVSPTIFLNDRPLDIPVGHMSFFIPAKYN